MSTVHENTRELAIQQALHELRGKLSGSLIEPRDPLYEEARRVWNGMVDLRPRAVVRAGALPDIDAVLDAVRRTGLALAVRGGGHNVAGHGTVDGGLVLDLGQLKRVQVYAGSKLVTVEPGATLADVDRETAVHNLAVPLGVISGTGVAGLTLGGGVGWLTRSSGLSLDNLECVDIVTATGEHLHAAAHENPELFWGLRRRRKLWRGDVLYLPCPRAAAGPAGREPVLPAGTLARGPACLCRLDPWPAR
ncbi:FAD-dependent oxidoreductase [Arthrobacter sp. AB6]|uniref:FAD-binding oxidoreductase n=1 Tax=Arthrobacter sp. AB6 TaxID=2962570 RepID=UPI002882E62D|nr:FAD-dependent oxidoreductase [Arthrobacter sp. AB6]